MLSEEHSYRNIIDSYTGYLSGLFLSFFKERYFETLTFHQSLDFHGKEKFIEKFSLSPEAFQRLVDAEKSLQSFEICTESISIEKTFNESQDFMSSDLVRDQLSRVHSSREYLKNSIEYDIFVVRNFLTPASTLLGLKTADMITDKVFGLDTPQIFDHYQSRPDLLRIYGKGFASSHLWSDLKFLSKLSFSKHEKIIDVGGSFGHLGNLILSRFEDVSYYLYDLPMVKNSFEIEINQLEYKFGSRFQFIPGNFFDVSLKGLLGSKEKYSKIFLGWILHDWNDDRCVSILKKCKQHLESKGEIIIFEVLPNERKLSFNLTDWLIMLMAGGYERTEDQYRHIFSRANLKIIEVQKTSTGRSMIRISNPESL